MIVRYALLTAVVLACHAVSFASSLADFTKVHEGVGAAVDLNNKRQVLLRNGNTAFSLFDVDTGVWTSVNLPAGLQSSGYVTLVVNDLSNTGYVTGFLNDTTPFIWSAQTGFLVVPAGYGGQFVNDAGVTVGPLGLWSVQSGPVALSIPGTVTALSNLGQIGYISPFVPNPGNPGGATVAGVLSSTGQSLFSQSFTATAPTGTPSIDDQFNMPDGVLLNDAGQVALVFSAIKAYVPHTEVYANGVKAFSYYDLGLGLNKQGQLVGVHNPNSLAGFGSSFGTSSETIELTALVGTAPLIRINDGGLILQDKGSSFALYQGPGTGASIPLGTGGGLKGQYVNKGLFGDKLVLTRTENPNFDWGSGRPAPAVTTNFFGVTWTGSVQAEEAGAYRFQTQSDDGVRVTLDGKVIIDHWRAHKVATDISGTVVLEAGKRYQIVVDYYDLLGEAVMRLSWQKPNATSFTAIPTTRLYQP